jgi:hypothetical protein
MPTSESTFLTELARFLGAHEPEDSTVLYLTLDTDVQVTVTLETSGHASVLLYAELGDSPTTDRFLRDIAQANFLGAGTQDSVLALRPDNRVVCLFRQVPLELHSPHDFVPLLQTFCEVASSWRQRLRSY